MVSGGSIPPWGTLRWSQWLVREHELEEVGQCVMLMLFGMNW